MKSLIAATLLLCSLNTSANVEVGIKGGNDLSATPVRGNISVFCYDGRQSLSARFRCSMDILEGGTHQRFVNKSGVDADKVKLTYRDDRGKKRSKTSKFDARKGQSKSRFNLWIWTLLQRPMLNYGENTIKFEMTKNKESVQKGEFQVNVTREQPRECYHRSYNSSSLSDCQNGNNICNYYFRTQNYCR